MKSSYRGRLWGKDSLNNTLGELLIREQVAAQLPTTFPSASGILQNSHCMWRWAQQLAKRSSGIPLGHLSIGLGPLLFCLRPESLLDFPKIQETPFAWVLSGPPLLRSLYPQWICEMWTSWFPWRVPFEMASWWGLGLKCGRIARLAGTCGQYKIFKNIKCPALTSVAQLAECHSTKRRVAGSIPGWGTCLCCRFGP